MLVEIYTDIYQLIYKDNGVGQPEKLDLTLIESLGLHLVRILADQVEGKAIYEQNEWITSKIRFQGCGHGNPYF